MSACALWFLFGFIAWVFGLVYGWYTGHSKTLGQFVTSLVICLILGGIAFIMVVCLALSLVFSSNTVILKGRKR